MIQFEMRDINEPWPDEVQQEIRMLKFWSNIAKAFTTTEEGTKWDRLMEVYE